MNEVLTAKEVARILEVRIKTVYAHAEELGGFKIGSHWRFPITRIEEVLRKRIRTYPTGDQ